MGEVLRNAVPVVQPSPAMNPGGDCFACALTAALRTLFPERDIQLRDVWNACMTGRAWGKDEPIINNNWKGMRANIYKAKSDLDLELETMVDFVQPHIDPEDWSCAWVGIGFGVDYTYRAEAWLAAGWLLLADIQFAGEGPLNSEGQLRGTDHTVLIDGARNVWVPTASGSYLAHEVHVVCSVRGAYWIKTMDLQRKHGAGAWRMVRRMERNYAHSDYVAEEVEAALA